MKSKVRTAWLGWLNRILNGLRRHAWHQIHIPNPHWKETMRVWDARKVAEMEIYRRRQRLGLMDSVAAFLGNSDATKKFFFGKARKEVVDNGNYFLNRQKMDTQKDNSTIRGSRIPEDVTEVRISRDKKERILFYKSIDFFVRGVRFNITNIQNFVPGFFNSVSNRAWAVSIDKEFHRLFGRIADKFLFVSQECSIKYTGLNIFGCNGREFLFHLFKAHPRSQSFKNYIYRYTGTLYARFSMLDIWIYADMFFKISFIEHLISPLCCKVISLPLIKSITRGAKGVKQ